LKCLPSSVSFNFNRFRNEIIKMWYYFGIVIHIVTCVALIMIVLLQTGKGAEMGAGLRGSSQTIFGGTGGTSFLGKITTVVAGAFMLTCIYLNLAGTPRTTRSIMENAPIEAPRGPAIPEATPVPTPGAPPVAGPDQQSSALPSQPVPPVPGQAAPVPGSNQPPANQ
jgi:preprotein translocase subunit SecG